MTAFKILILSVALYSCGSSKEEDNRVLEEREHENIKREYFVNDASSNKRPGWIEDAEIWAKQNGKDTEKYRFFSYETDPKVSRSIACDLAKANARADIASEISTFISKSLAESTEGDASIDENNPKIQKLQSYVENTLAEKVQALIQGASINKTYWERRAYKKERGAKKDFKAYVCAVFVRIETNQLKTSIEEAAAIVANNAGDNSTKAKVKNALNDVSENFVKRQQSAN